MALLQWGPDITGGKRFHIEDPNHEYQEVRRALHFDRGWARVGKKENCELRWTLDERAIDFDKLRDEQPEHRHAARAVVCARVRRGAPRLRWRPVRKLSAIEQVRPREPRFLVLRRSRRSSPRAR